MSTFNLNNCKTATVVTAGEDKITFKFRGGDAHTLPFYNDPVMGIRAGDDIVVHNMRGGRLRAYQRVSGAFTGVETAEVGGLVRSRMV